MKLNQYSSKEELFMDFPKGGVGAELGVAKGCNAIRLLHLTQPKKMYLVDWWANEDKGRWDNGAEVHLHVVQNEHRLNFEHYGELVQEKFEGHDNVVLCRSDFYTWMNSMEDNSLDWVYLDGSHLYNDTKAELAGVHRLVKPGGIIAGHDFQANFAWGFGVVAPVIEFIQDGKMKMTGISADDEEIHYCSYMCEVIK